MLFCQTGIVEEVQVVVGEFICRASQTDIQLAAGRIALELVSRSQTDGNFYPHSAFLQLLKTQYLCHRFEHNIDKILPIFLFGVFYADVILLCSVCPGILLLALEKKDFGLCQIAFQLFPDIPEAITCAYLKAILR